MDMYAREGLYPRQSSAQVHIDPTTRVGTSLFPRITAAAAAVTAPLILCEYCYTYT